MLSRAPVQPSATTRVDELLDEVVRRVSSAAGASTEPRMLPHVLLDAEVQGVRCLFLRTADDTRRPRLSPREREIGRMVAKGYANKTIASVLDISTWTVSAHLRRIFAKMGVSTRAAMVAQLAGEGLLSD